MRLKFYNGQYITMDTKITVKKIAEVSDFFRTHSTDPLVCLLFGGDRGTVCDEVVMLQSGRSILALASISPNGETGEGPGIVGLYVVPKYRKCGYGKHVMEATVRRCIERGFSKVRIDTLSKGAKYIVETLPNELNSVLDIHHSGEVLDMFTGLAPK